MASAMPMVIFTMDNTQAIVVKHTGSHYLLTVLPQWNLFPAVLRGRIRQKGSSSTNPVAVGDRVVFELPEGRNLTDAIGTGTASSAIIITVENVPFVSEKNGRRTTGEKRDGKMDRKSFTASV